jgi:hypothetical protein
VSERRIITYIGTIDTENGEALIIPPGLDPDEIKAAIEAANRAKRDAAMQESLRLRQLFLDEQAGQRASNRNEFFSAHMRAARRMSSYRRRRSREPMPNLTPNAQRKRGLSRKPRSRSCRRRAAKAA